MSLVRRPGRGGAGPRVRPAVGRRAVLRVAWPVLRAELRVSWRAWPALALVVGLAGGAVLTAAAGA